MNNIPLKCWDADMITHGDDTNNHNRQDTQKLNNRQRSNIKIVHKYIEVSPENTSYGINVFSENKGDFID